MSEVDKKIDNNAENANGDESIPIPGYPGQLFSFEAVRRLEEREAEGRQPRRQKRTHQLPKREMSRPAKYLWVGAFITAATVAGGKIYEILSSFHQPTPTEMKAMDHILRPAAINAARVAIELNKLNPQPVGPPQEPGIRFNNAVELGVTGPDNTTIVVDLLRRNGRLEPATVFNVVVGNNMLNQAGVMITRIEEPQSENQGYRLGKEFLVASAGTEASTADMTSAVTNSSAHQQLAEARKLAAEVDNEVNKVKAAE